MPLISHIIMSSSPSSLDHTIVLQVLGNLKHSLLNTRLLRVNVNLGILWCLIWSTDSSELLNLSSSCLLVQTLGVTLLGLLNGDVDKDLDEGKWGVDVLGVGVEIAGELAVGLVWGDERGQGDGGGVGEELGDLEKV